MSVTPSLENRVVIDLRAFRVHIIDMAYTGGIISLISGEMRGPVGSRLYSWTTIRFRVALGVYVRGRFCTTESKEEPDQMRDKTSCSGERAAPRAQEVESGETSNDDIGTFVKNQ
jgi:hypothetical protein